MVDYSQYKTLMVEKKDKVLTVTLNRPKAMNAVSREMHRELADIFVDINKDDETNVIILTGAGPAFSAGGDMKGIEEMKADPSMGIPMSEPKELIQNLLLLRKPIIAAVNGDCMGLGASLALSCDIIFAAETARFADPHVNVGLVAGDGGCIAWPLLTSLCRAKYYLMTGTMIKAPEAERLGLINKVVPAEGLMEEVGKLAKKIADGATQAINSTKIVLNKIALERFNLLFDAAVAYEYHTLHTDDYIEALQAFMEKRLPKFKGA